MKQASTFESPLYEIEKLELLSLKYIVFWGGGKLEDVLTSIETLINSFEIWKIFFTEL